MVDLILNAALATYLAVVAWGTLGPSPGEQVERAARGAETARRTVAGDDRPPEVSREPSFAGLTGEEAGNVAMFVPFGILVPMRLRSCGWRLATVPLAVVLSSAIEGAQLVLVDHRSPEWGDVGWNSLGGLVGFVVWLTAWLLWRRYRPPPGRSR